MLLQREHFGLQRFAQLFGARGHLLTALFDQLSAADDFIDDANLIGDSFDAAIDLLEIGLVLGHRYPFADAERTRDRYGEPQVTS
jgi:hypothetical protein